MTEERVVISWTLSFLFMIQGDEEKLEAEEGTGEMARGCSLLLGDYSCVNTFLPTESPDLV